MVINVYSKSSGWLLDDLKREIEGCGAVASELPISNADAYICLRDSEAHLSPNKKKTVVQIHGVSRPIKGYGHYSFSHPHSQSLSGLSKRFSIDPVGSRDIADYDLPSKPVIGFFCKESAGEKGAKLFLESVMMAQKEASFSVLIIGENIPRVRVVGAYESRASEPEDYSRISALVTCDTRPTVPISAYEALACGREVISTPRQWIGGIHNIRTIYDKYDLSLALQSHARDMYKFKPQKPYNRRQWAKRQIELAKSLCK